MPQMSPLSWITLFIYFIIVLLMFCVMNYYTTYYSTPLSMKKSFNKISLNWKW